MPYFKVGKGKNPNMALEEVVVSTGGFKTASDFIGALPTGKILPTVTFKVFRNTVALPKGTRLVCA